MKVHYDKEQDILYLAFKEGPSHEILESAPNVILELNEIKEIMVLEIWNAKKTGLLGQGCKISWLVTKTTRKGNENSEIQSTRIIQKPEIPKETPRTSPSAL